MPRVELDIHGDGPTVTGTVRAEGGEVRAFLGWLGLVALLEQAVADDGDGSEARAMG